MFLYFRRGLQHGPSDWEVASPAFFPFRCNNRAVNSKRVRTISAKVLSLHQIFASEQHRALWAACEVAQAVFFCNCLGCCAKVHFDMANLVLPFNARKAHAELRSLFAESFLVYENFTCRQQFIQASLGFFDPCMTARSHNDFIWGKWSMRLAAR